jgi:AcrR family transcriptional regulator
MSAKQDRQQKTREEILKVAKKMISKDGLDNLSIRKVAKAVNYSPSGLYEYFKNKDDLINCLAQRSKEILNKKLNNAAKKQNPLFEIGLEYINFATNFSTDFKLFFLWTPSKRENLKEEVPKDSPYFIVLNVVKNEIENGVLKKRNLDDLETITYILWSLMHGISILLITHLSQFHATKKQ